MPRSSTRQLCGQKKAAAHTPKINKTKFFRTGWSSDFKIIQIQGEEFWIQILWNLAGGQTYGFETTTMGSGCYVVNPSENLKWFFTAKKTKHNSLTRPKDVERRVGFSIKAATLLPAQEKKRGRCQSKEGIRRHTIPTHAFAEKSGTHAFCERACMCACACACVKGKMKWNNSKPCWAKISTKKKKSPFCFTALSWYFKRMPPFRLHTSHLFGGFEASNPPNRCEVWSSCCR